MLRKEQNVIKMPTIFARKDVLATMEADVLARTRRLGALEAQVAQARADAEKARAHFDATVDTAQDEDATAGERIDSARRAFTEAEANANALAGTMERSRADLADQAAYLATARDKATREVEAAAIEARCEAIEQAAARLDAPVAALAKTVKALMPEVEAAYAHTMYGKTDAITGAIVAEAICKAMPSLFGFVRCGSSVATQPGSGLVRATLLPNGDLIQTFPAPANEARTAAAYVKAAMLPERSRAAAIRSGDAALPPAPKPQRVVEPEFRADTTVLLVVLVKQVKYRDRFGDEVVKIAGQTQLPKMVAEEAIRRGLAHRTNTNQAAVAGERIALARREGGVPPPDPRTAVDLGINLSDVVAADIAEQRKAWLKGQGGVAA